jgi:uncharacterized integral membrane protein
MTAAQNHRYRPKSNNGRPTPAGPAVPRCRAGGLWVAAVVFAGVLLLLLMFVPQNGRWVEVSYVGAHGQLLLGVALLLAAVFGVLLGPVAVKPPCGVSATPLHTLGRFRHAHHR